MSTDEGAENVRRERKSTFPTKVYFVDLKPLIQFDYPLNYHSKTLESPYLLYFTFREARILDASGSTILAPLFLLSRLFAKKR